MKPISFSYSEHERLKAENEQLTADVEGWKQNFTTERNNRIAVTADLDAAVGDMESIVDGKDCCDLCENYGKCQNRCANSCGLFMWRGSGKEQSNG